MLFKILLICHIIMGTMAMISSIGAICTKKGSALHRRFGRFFFYGMSAIFITAIPMSIMTSNIFLFTVAVFSYYFVFSGWRYAKLHNVVVPVWDWLVTIVMFITALSMIAIGIWQINFGGSNPIVLVVFGIVGCVSAIKDAALFYSGKISNKTRIARHLGGMLGGTIATFTAVLVVNVKFNPQFVIWLAPTLLISPLIIYWTRKVMMERAVKQ